MSKHFEVVSYSILDKMKYLLFREALDVRGNDGPVGW